MRKRKDEDHSRPDTFYKQLQGRLLQHILQRILQIEAAMLLVIVGIVSVYIIRYSNQLNYKVAGEMNSTLQNYQELLEFAAELNSGNLSRVSSTFQHDVMEKYSSLQRCLKVRGDLYFLDAAGKPYISNMGYVREEEQEELMRQWHFMSQASHRSNTLVSGISRSYPHSLWLAYYTKDNFNHVKTDVLLRIKAEYLSRLFETQPVQALLVQQDDWALAPNSTKVLDAINQLPVELSTRGLKFWRGRFYYVCYIPLTAFGLRVYTMWEVTTFIRFLLVIAVTSALLLLLLYYLSLRNSRCLAQEFAADIVTLKEALAQAEKGNLEHTLAIDSSLEMQAIGHAYNQLLLGFKRQLQENAQLERIVANEQIKQLGSQFTNHFLFNTLDNIYYMCRISPDLAEMMVLNLAKLLRYNTHSPNEKVTLAEDGQYIRLYLEIIKVRFHDAFDYAVTIDKEVEDCLLPKLLLQPIIENAIKYGRQTQTALQLQLSAQLQDGKVVLICRDNGPGISEDKLGLLQKDLVAAENYSRHLGLYNVARRVALTYGKGYGIQLHNKNGLEVKVTIKAEYEAQD